MTFTEFKHRNGFFGEISKEWEEMLYEKYLEYLNRSANKIGSEKHNN